MSAWGTELCIVHDSTIPLATREIFRVGLGAVGFQLGLTGPSGVAGKAAGCVDLTIVDDCCVLLLLPVADPFCELAEERPFNVVDLRATSRAPGTPFDVEFPFGMIEPRGLDTVCCAPDNRTR